MSSANRPGFVTLRYVTFRHFLFPPNASICGTKNVVGRDGMPKSEPIKGAAIGWWSRARFGVVALVRHALRGLRGWYILRPTCAG